MGLYSYKVNPSTINFRVVLYSALLSSKLLYSNSKNNYIGKQES